MRVLLRIAPTGVLAAVLLVGVGAAWAAPAARVAIGGFFLLDRRRRSSAQTTA
jgi:hypothetical protein